MRTHRLLGISEGRFALAGYDNVPPEVLAKLASFEKKCSLILPSVHSPKMNPASCG